ncbi:urease accessory protein UreF [Defluviimonas sp. SAOS-178_SWC]|uniref:urease accessory protein UreF n=1 Tax=Defluviimonas sp. SAOS-178_SWC TaxID=3121287 RepID=UPI0032221F40
MSSNFAAQDQERQLFLLQIANSSFPTGGFNHSYGFETWFQSGTVHDAVSFRVACRDWLRYGLARSEGIAVARACEMARFGDLDGLPALDRKLGALKLSREARAASSMTGQALLEAYADIFGRPGLEDFARRAEAGTVEAHHAVVFGAICGAHDIGAPEAVLTFLQGAVTSLAGVACRLIPLGQVETQRAITESWPFIQAFSSEVMEFGIDDMNTAMLSLDVAAMQHETLRTRLCIS